MFIHSQKNSFCGYAEGPRLSFEYSCGQTTISMEAENRNDAATIVSIQIPQNAEAGDTLSFEVNGQSLDFPIPTGSEPGDFLEIRLTDRNRCEESTSQSNNDYAAFRMSSGVEIVVASDASRFVPNDGTMPPPVNQANDGTFSLIWPATRYALKFVNSQDFLELLHCSEIRSVVELGAGHHGLFGMAFSEALSHLPLRDTIKVTLTDMDDAIPHLQANIDRNRNLFGERVDISTASLVWHTLPLPLSTCRLDWIIGCDLLYRCSNIPSLAATILRLLSKTTKILLSVRWRKPEEERVFFSLLSDTITWKLIHGHCMLDYTQYGNPKCAESNKFFSQTMVGVAGQPTPLALIDTTQSERMTNKEFEQFEYFQTQLYLGSVVNKQPSTAMLDAVTFSGKKRQRI